MTDPGAVFAPVVQCESCWAVVSKALTCESERLKGLSSDLQRRPLGSSIIRFLDGITKKDVSFAGGKGANLGEMYRFGLPVPPAFVVTTKANELFANSYGLEKKVQGILEGIDVDDLGGLNRKAAQIRGMIEHLRVPSEVAAQIGLAYDELCRQTDTHDISVAVRSSATMEDLREASFAGQQATVLNVRGMKEVLSSVLKCWASVYTARGIFYRTKRGFGSHTISTAVVVQRLVMSEKAGVGFTLHPLTGDPDVIVVEGSFGQGEDVVSGRVTPDTFVMDKKTGKVLERRIARKTSFRKASKKGSGLVEAKVQAGLRDKPALSDEELAKLWKLGRALEEHYGHPQDFEWAFEKGEVYLVQTRAVTVIAKEKKTQGVMETPPILKGLGSSPGLGSGPVKLVLTMDDLKRVEKGDVLVTRMTTPDFVPAMLKTAGIVTDEGGMTSHAAIVSRELGVPCVVGTSEATKLLKDGMLVTVDGSNGSVLEGRVSSAASPDKAGEQIEHARKLVNRTKVYMNLGVPDKIKDYARMPFDGIGLMRVEFIIASYVGEHPLSLIDRGKGDFFTEKLADGIASVAKEISPRPVVVRFSDFKSNEYRELQGGEKYEDLESNPMIGWRGVSRYIANEYQQAFRLEVRAIKKVREEMGLRNVWVMLPFVRTTWEVEKCIKIVEDEGLHREHDFRIWLMAEVPSMVFLAEEFASLCDGFSIGSNDLTQLILGIDRDSGRLGRMGYFDERNAAVKKALKLLVEGAHRKGKTVSICGQAPSVYPELADYLVRLGIDSISVNPDTVVKTKELVHEVETRLGTLAPPGS